MVLEAKQTLNGNSSAGKHRSTAHNFRINGDEIVQYHFFFFQNYSIELVEE